VYTVIPPSWSDFVSQTDADAVYHRKKYMYEPDLLSVGQFQVFNISLTLGSSRAACAESHDLEAWTRMRVCIERSLDDFIRGFFSLA